MMKSEETSSMIPSKPIKLYAPLAYNQIHQNLYRSSYPTPRNYSFIEKLQIKSFLCLVPNDINQELRNYCSEKSIVLYEFDVKMNQEPFVSMDSNEVRKAVQTMSGDANQIITIIHLTFIL